MHSRHLVERAARFAVKLGLRRHAQPLVQLLDGLLKLLQHARSADQVEPELGRQLTDPLQSLQVGIRVAAGAAGRPPRRYEALGSYIRNVCGCMSTSSAATEIE